MHAQLSGFVDERTLERLRAAARARLAVAETTAPGASAPVEPFTDDPHDAIHADAEPVLPGA
jgi:hypothetical protein